MKKNVAILILDRASALDVTGPLEVFLCTRTEPDSASRRTTDSAPFHVFTLARTEQAASTTGDLRVVPHGGYPRAVEP